MLSLPVSLVLTAGAQAQSPRSYLGMDRNDYPGDAAMKTLRQTFAFTGYWLNNPPGATQNTWQAHRKDVETMGYGFLILFNGREYSAIKASGDAARLGTTDAEAAAESARREGFPSSRNSWKNSIRNREPHGRCVDA